jgi:hypothetical protein
MIVRKKVKKHRGIRQDCVTLQEIRPDYGEDNRKQYNIVFYKKEMEDYISLTDIAKIRDTENPSQIISLWLRTYSTIEYLGLWEKLNNPNFNPPHL